MTNLDLLDKLAERIKEIPRFAMSPEIEANKLQQADRRVFSLGKEIGLYLALNEIADMKREIENGRD